MHTVCGPGRVWALALPDRLGDSLAGHVAGLNTEKNLPFLNALRASTILAQDLGEEVSSLYSRFPAGCFTKKLSWTRGNGIGIVTAGEAAPPAQPFGRTVAYAA